LVRAVRNAGAWMLLIVLGACSSWHAPVPTEPAPVEQSVPVADGSRDVAETDPLPMTQAPTVAVVLARGTPFFAAVADALERSLEGRAVRYEIDDRNRERVLADVRAAGHADAVAIGQQALRLLDATDLPITYCQVFDPGTHRRGGGGGGAGGD
jgi:hypothetical protein